MSNPSPSPTQHTQAPSSAALMPWRQQPTDLLVDVIQRSLYPGASKESAMLVINYCTSTGLDLMKKPVHIVPMRVKVLDEHGQPKVDPKGKQIYASRDVIMPGIGLYRSQAADTGEYAGCDAPEFGPTQVLRYSKKYWTDDGDRRVQKFREAELEYPEWCKFTVRRIVEGKVCEFVAVEYWLENYATAGNDTNAPNEMWEKRVRAQLAKCAEAQALRRAFSDRTGSEPTYEEMEGKAYIEHGDIQADHTVRPKADQGKAQPKVSDRLQSDLKDASAAGTAFFKAYWDKLPQETRNSAQHVFGQLMKRAERADELLADERAAEAAVAGAKNITPQKDESAADFDPTDPATAQPAADPQPGTDY